MNKVLILTGPTATGKTSLAVKISKKIPSILISADSRQVYKGMDIVTGKDHPSKINIKALDIANPDKQVSVAEWLAIAQKEIKESWEQHKLPIVVGGTGFYIRALTEEIDTVGIPPKPKLRKELETHSLELLQQKLKKLNPARFEKMNNSDRNNPRRLIRAIEIANSAPTQKITKLKADYKQISLASPPDYKKVIRKRVLARLENDASIKETEKLLTQYDKSHESFTGIGYKTIIDYLEKKITMEELIEKWTQAELSYSKRQLTWLKKQQTISVQSNSPEELSQVVKDVKNWYYKK